MEEMIKKADVLIEALPYIQSFYEKTVVIKYGGAVLTDTEIRRNVLEDIIFMNYVGMRPILVHGGGPYISKRIEELGKEVKFVRGYRVTDEETMEVVEEELSRSRRSGAARSRCPARRTISSRSRSTPTSTARISVSSARSPGSTATSCSA